MQTTLIKAVVQALRECADGFYTVAKFSSTIGFVLGSLATYGIYEGQYIDLPEHKTSASSISRSTPKGNLLKADAQTFLMSRSDLTQEEKQVLVLTVQGFRTWEIADTLGISAVYVNVLQNDIQEKLGVDTNAQLIEKAREEGWLDNDTR